MPKLIAAKCQKCGMESQVEWTLGARCPKCGSEKFFPMVYVEKEKAGEQRKARGAFFQRPMGLALALLLFVGGATALIVSARSTFKKQKYYTTLTMVCTNADCEKLFRKRMPTRDAFLPNIICRYCKKKTAFRAVQCRGCGTVFALKPGPSPKVNPIYDLKCPKCNSGDINLESSSLPLEEEEGEK